MCVACFCMLPHDFWAPKKHQKGCRRPSKSTQMGGQRSTFYMCFCVEITMQLLKTHVFYKCLMFFYKKSDPYPKGSSMGRPGGSQRDPRSGFWRFLGSLLEVLKPPGEVYGSLLEVSGYLWEMFGPPRDVFGSPSGGVRLGGDLHRLKSPVPDPKSQIPNPESQISTP